MHGDEAGRRSSACSWLESTLEGEKGESMSEKDWRGEDDIREIGGTKCQWFCTLRKLFLREIGGSAVRE